MNDSFVHRGYRVWSFDITTSHVKIEDPSGEFICIAENGGAAIKIIDEWKNAR